MPSALLALALALATQTSAQPPGKPGAQTAAILPFHSQVASEDALDLLASVLAEQLAELGDWKVISPEELRALLQNEQSRQALGGGEDEALREASGALGAREVVQGEVVRLDKRLIWRATLVDQSAGEIRQRGEVSGNSVQALAGRADELALMLLGRRDEAEDPEAVADRLGFENASDARDFEGFRERNPELGTGEALTRYIIANNVESNRLAIVEALLVGGGAAGTTLALALGFGGFLVPLILPVGPLALVLSFLAIVSGVTSLVLLASGVGVVVVDGLNRSFRPVKKSGCCRDDAEVADAWAATALRRTAAFVVLLAGPWSIAASFGVVVFAGTTYVTATTLRLGWGIPPFPEGYTVSPAYLVTTVLAGPVYLCTILACVVPLFVSVPLGIALLAWPTRAPVSSLEAE